MPQLFWNPLSISYLVEALLMAIVAAFFLHRAIAGQEKLLKLGIEPLLFVFFFFSAVGMACQLLAILMHPDFSPWMFILISPLGALSVMTFLLFSARFMRKNPSLRMSEKLLILLFLILIVSELYIASARIKLLEEGVVEYRENWIAVTYGILFLLSPIFFASHLVTAHAQGTSRHWVHSVRPALRGLFWTSSKLPDHALPARAFFFVAMLPMAAGLIHVARNLGFIEWNTMLVLGSWVVLFFLTSFTLVYLNYIPERSTYLVKLVGVTLTVVLALLSSISWLIGDDYSAAYDNESWAKSKTAIRYIAPENGGYIVSRGEFTPDTEIGERWSDFSKPIELPFAFPFYGKEYTSFFAHPGGMVGFHKPPRWQDIEYRFGPQPAIFLAATELGESGGNPDSGIFVKQEKDKVVVTWRQLVSKHTPEQEYTFQLKLHSSGKIEQNYIDVPDKPQADIFNANAAPILTGIVPAFKDRIIAPIRHFDVQPFTAAPGQAIAQNHRIVYLEYLNRIYAPIGYFIFASTLLIIVIFPLFFGVSLDRPLKKLISGVQEILKGKLDTSIAVVHRDEIGFLASSFNDMTKAQRELIEELESKVVKRTTEASEYAARNARLEERNHLSRELHDSVSQTLFSANLIADTLPELLKKEPKHAHDAVAQIQQLNKDALTEMRNLLLELSPHRLSSTLFGQLLNELAEEFKELYAIDMDIQIEGNVALSEAVQLSFFRVAQECLANCGKHSHASNISIYFDGMNTQALLTVQDDGNGFAASEVTARSLGLQIMEERMNRIGGSLEIESKPGQGTKITAIWIENDTGQENQNIAGRRSYGRAQRPRSGVQQ